MYQYKKVWYEVVQDWRLPTEILIMLSVHISNYTPAQD